VRVPRRARFTAILLTFALAALGAACGDDDEDEPAPAPARTRTDAKPPKATTGEPPGARTGPPPEERERRKGATTDQQGNPVVRPVGRSFRCGGRRQRALSASGPVEVEPPVIAPGESFTVTVTDESARAALVQLAGVADEPIEAEATRSAGRLRATIRMPARVTCGNKLVIVEGDVSAEAYVGVRR
jgi:hypothetical protein